MITVTLQADKFNAGVQAFGVRAQEGFRLAVRQGAARVLERLVQHMQAPPYIAKYYIRPGPLVSGWKPAGDALGVSVPTAGPRAKGREEGSITPQLDGDLLSIVMSNATPYASGVEYPGPWVTPYPKRLPYRTVNISLEESVEDYAAILVAAWSNLS